MWRGLFELERPAASDIRAGSASMPTAVAGASAECQQQSGRRAGCQGWVGPGRWRWSGGRVLPERGRTRSLALGLIEKREQEGITAYEMGE
ncbi:unnamed protein product [Gadus morhua 'NCC']